MKRPAVILLTLLLNTAAMAQSVFYCTKAGHVNEWTLFDADGEVSGYCIETLKAAEGSLEEGSIAFAYDFKDEDGKSVIGGRSLNLHIRMSEGQIRAELDNVAKALKSGDYMCKGDVSSIPADIKVGDIIQDNTIPISVAGIIKSHNDIRQRRVTGKETVKTSAGTFDCFIIEEKEYDQGSSKPFILKSWIAPQIGFIRQQISDEKGRLVRTCELTRLVH